MVDMVKGRSKTKKQNPFILNFDAILIFFFGNSYINPEFLHQKKNLLIHHWMLKTGIISFFIIFHGFICGLDPSRVNFLKIHRINDSVPEFCYEHKHSVWSVLAIIKATTKLVSIQKTRLPSSCPTDKHCTNAVSPLMIADKMLHSYLSILHTH
jgi:hypothetical protein